ncbi:MAG: hypothetical protein ACTHO8_05835 [Solirubrobacterales bacterium]
MSTVSITGNYALDHAATAKNTSTVGEPSVALVGDNAFVSGNWYASRSTNGGLSWTHVDPFTAFPATAGGFCCDQVVLHDQVRGVWIWILQYMQKDGANVFRLAASRDASGGWHSWTIAPTTLDPSWSNLWFDYPDAALTHDSLYVTFNVFDSGGKWQRAVAMRFPLDTIAKSGPISPNWWATTQNGSLRLTQGAASTMYWASHNSQQQVRLFRWIDGQSAINWWDVGVNQWSNAIHSIAPNKVDWLGRADGRITGATVGGGRICLMWTAGAQNGRPHAYCRVVRINEASKAVIDQPDIWDIDRAWAYPATCANRAGTIGVTAFCGGGHHHPGHVVGIRDDSANAWRAVYSNRLEANSPAEPKWGDYLTCRTDGKDGNSWVAAGYTLAGGEARTNIIPRIVQFTLK